MEELIITELVRKISELESIIRDSSSNIGEIRNRVDALYSTLSDIRSVLSEVVLELRAVREECRNRILAVVEWASDMLTKVEKLCRS